MEVDRTEVGRPLWASCGRGLKFVIPLEVSGYKGIWKLIVGSTENIR